MTASGLPGTVAPDNSVAEAPKSSAGFAAFRNVAAGKWKYAPGTGEKWIDGMLILSASAHVLTLYYTKP